MNHTSVLALAALLVAAPLAAQPKGEGPVGPGPITAGPMGIGPIGPGPMDIGPIGPGPMDIGPIGPGPMGLGPMKIGPLPDFAELDRALQAAKPALLDAVAEAPMLAARAKMIVDSFAFDSFAFEFGQDKADREAERRDREAEMREREREREAQWYSEGQNAADEYRWDRALSFFNRVVELKGSKADAALYWKAFSQNRLGQRTEALATIAELSKGYPNSAYRRQATVLEAEVKRDIGQPVRPQDSADDEVKLMALQALQNTAPEEAVPMLEKVLEGTSSRRVKQRALYVLAQSKSPRAREVLRNYAKGSSTPELQSQAIQYLGVHGGPEALVVLAEVYATTTDVDVKRRILRAFMVARDKDRLFKAAQGEQNPELRLEAVTQLGNMQAQEELQQLYLKETSVDVKRRIIRSMMTSGSVDRLIELAKTEQNPELRRDAVRTLGQMRSARTADVLVQIYASDTNVDVKKSVVNALFTQDNATALVGLARKEQDVNHEEGDRLAALEHAQQSGHRLHDRAARQVGAHHVEDFHYPRIRARRRRPHGGGRPAQQPRLTNGRVTTQPAVTLQQAFRAAVDSHADVGWVGYGVPVVDGERVMCCFNSGNTFVSGVSGGNQACCGMCSLDPSPDGTMMSSRPQPGQPAGAVKLEGADTMILLFRVVNRQVERVRVFSEDCQLDAGGREVRWLTGVKPVESIALLESLIAAQPATERRDRIVDGSISAIALHEDAAATAALERLLSCVAAAARAGESALLARQHSRTARPRDPAAGHQGRQLR